MTQTNISSVVLFGTGNVGTHFAKALIESGIELKQIYSRNPDHARELGSKKNVVAISDLKKADTTADLWIISVTDDAIPEILDQLPDFNGIVAHTAGSIPIDILSRFEKRGVFYPFQTLSKDRAVDYNEVPFLIEGSDPETTRKLLKLAGILSERVSEADSSLRATLHIAAVLSCNFVNHLYTLSADLLEEGGLSFKYLTPLIKETTQKVLYMLPQNAQTGPAIRNDKAVIDKHIERLRDNPSLQDIYRLLSHDILQYHKRE
ncbi:Rossmann-like and DUF2520 domain-containing protein [Marinilabilia rubra]|uniref:DUF2520 domain-containing protein n=1 Tax=Marinilabilia rubra TaxID=2162893 RepID=A0A2U2B553_9BACT|nr:DUF2520 domain-containing protein [Marinilabilia rubra]PWD98186.1 DUF2520 domain-containing protein [Marinilabilia rubra]